MAGEVCRSWQGDLVGWDGATHYACPLPARWHNSTQGCTSNKSFSSGCSPSSTICHILQTNSLHLT